MSTKTVLKRVALVAVASLAIGGVSAVSANAVANLAITTGYTGVGTQTGSAIAGPANSTSVTAGGAAEYVTISGGTFASGVTSATLAAAGSILVQTPSVGTITVSGYAQTGPGVFSATVTDTVTITVLAAPAGTVYNHSTAFIGAVGADVTVDAAQTAPQAASNTAIAQITVSQYSSTDGSVRLNDANTNAVVVSISGAGLVGTSAATRGPAAAVGAGTANSSTVPNIGVQNFFVYPSGQAGTGTITVSVNGAVVATKTVTFTGTFAAYTTASTQLAPLGVGATDAIVYTGLDANKNVAAIAGTTAASSSNTAVATVGVAGNTVSVTGVAPGTATITVTNGATPAITTTLSYTVTKVTAKTVSLAFDKSSYAPGEKITLTVSAVDSNGAAVADGAKNLFSAAGVTANVNLVGALPATSVTLAGGKATYTLYAPFAAGNIVVTGAEGAATDNVIANGTSAAASISASATVVADTSALDAANAAADAAAEATDAANAATDAANAAADAADSATSAAQDAADQAGQALAAVNTLATSVASLIAGIKAQLTSLTNLVVKLQASVAVLPKK